MGRSSPDQARRALFGRLTEPVAPRGERDGFEVRTDDGRFIGPFHPCRPSPEIAARFPEFPFAERENSPLGERVRRVVVLAAGAVWRSAYGLHAHPAVARAEAALSGEAVDIPAQGGVPDEPAPAERRAWRFAHRLSADRRLDRAVYDEAEAAFGTRGVMGMLLLIGAYQAVCGVPDAFEIPAPVRK